MNASALGKGFDEHANFLKLIDASKGAVVGLGHFSKENSHNCEICAKGKAQQTKIGKEPVEKAKEVLDKVHSDLCGLLPETV